MNTTRTAKPATAANSSRPEGDIITFLRKRDYRFIRELGQGACGKTVLLMDEDIQAHVVCKKYVPHSEDERVALYQLFVREIKLLYQLHHPNVVRCFHHYLYPQITAGFILMEYIEGKDIADHISDAPEQINDLFLQAIDGFAYLESKGIMHRDIRPTNILVTNDGRLKIIDLGFGKYVTSAKDFEKSISLNWYGESPAEFSEGRYNFTTEIYFVGKLFERLIQDHLIEHFQYKDSIRGMCAHRENERHQSFAEIQRQLRTQQFGDSGFSASDLEIYRDFSATLAKHITRIGENTKYTTDVERLMAQLAETHRRCMLETMVPDAATIIQCLLSGPYYYRKVGFPTSTLRQFYELLKRASNDQRNIIIANLHTKMDAIERYDLLFDDSEIPF